MIIGVPKEIKNNEYRVGLIPAGVKRLVEQGHTVYVEKDAGIGSGISNEEYEKAGAKILNSAKEIYEKVEMIIKVKEPLPQEYPLIKENQILFTYFHFASSKELTDAMLKSGAICIAYETIETSDKKLPLLIPMSEIAGRLSVQEGAKYLEKPFGGRGVLLGGVPGVKPAKVAIIGGGVVGSNAAQIASGFLADVYIFDINLERLRYLSHILPKNVKTLYSDHYTLMNVLKEADLVIGAVLIPGAKAPKLITREMLKVMKPNSVIVDVAIDQGGCCETSKPTTHSEPTFVVDNVVHYCVANMPGAVPRTSTFALNNATIPYAIEIANKGINACKEREDIKKGLNIYKGKITYKHVAEAFDYEYVPPEKIL